MSLGAISRLGRCADRVLSFPGPQWGRRQRAGVAAIDKPPAAGGRDPWALLAPLSPLPEPAGAPAAVLPPLRAPGGGETEDRALPIPLRDTADALEQLLEDWAEDLELVLDERVARTFARHFIEDLANRFQVRPRQKPRAPAAKP